MSWSYSTNVMGPYGLWWYEQNNIPFEIIQVPASKLLNLPAYERKHYLETYYGGRIDCYCSNPDDPDYDPYNRETYLPIMIGPEFAKFDAWLDQHTSDHLQQFDELRSLYEQETGNKLILFKENR